MFKVRVRATDHVSRWGGEEFLSLLPAGNRETAQRVCERIRHSVALGSAGTSDDRLVPVTALLGEPPTPTEMHGRLCWRGPTPRSTSQRRPGAIVRLGPNYITKPHRGRKRPRYVESLPVR
jgi:hypothetical protein